MDLNGDGKQDWKDHVDAYNINNMANDESSFGYGSNSTDSKLSPLSKTVIFLTIALCIFALFSGSAHIILDLLGFGIIAFLIAQWLSN